MRRFPRFMIPARRAPRAAAGFTLVEAVMVIVLIGILAAVGAPMIAHGMRLSIQTSADLTTVSQLRYATERIAREIREVSFNTGTGNYNITSMTATNLAFTKANGTAVTIAYASPNITVNYAGTGAASLSNQATALQFTYVNVSPPVVTTSPSFVTVQLSLQNPGTGATYTQSTRVNLRNRQ
jgi:MSHA biogenesis protein MshO